MREVSLPSGAILKVQEAPFEQSNALYEAFLEVTKVLKLNEDANMDINLFKDIFAHLMTSKQFRACLSECMKRCTYSDMKIEMSLFEPSNCRQDWNHVCVEVAEENLRPFLKSLSAGLSRILQLMVGSRA